MKKLLLLLLLTACASQSMQPGCHLYVNRYTNSIETVVEYGKTCVMPDGSIKTQIDYVEHQPNPPIYVPTPHFQR